MNGHTNIIHAKCQIGGEERTLRIQRNFLEKFEIKLVSRHEKKSKAKICTNIWECVIPSFLFISESTEESIDGNVWKCGKGQRVKRLE